MRYKGHWHDNINYDAYVCKDKIKLIHSLRDIKKSETLKKSTLNMKLIINVIFALLYNYGFWTKCKII